VCRRRGRKEKSSACGALNVFLNEISNPPSPPFLKGGKGGLKPSLTNIDQNDIELSLIRMRLSKEIPYGHIPDLLELTKITLKTIKEDFENALSKTVHTDKADYALITGIQIHGPEGNYIWPAEQYAIVNGKKQKIKLIK
jgi:hypothetical protein